jgi:hypothetical protein
MTYAFTDTVQIDEQWEIPTNLDAVLSQVDEILENRYCIWGEFTTSGDNEWATDLAIQGILEGKNPSDIADTIASEYEPSDAEMMAANSCGTAWHDCL